jgi:UDP-N-acetylglucosamine 2-epimerase
MIERKLNSGAWSNEEIAEALNVLAGAGNHVQLAYFYCDRVVMTARPLKDKRGVLATVHRKEVIGKEDYYDIINRLHREIKKKLEMMVMTMEHMMPAGIE